MMMLPKCHAFLLVTAVVFLLSIFPLPIWSFHGRQNTRRSFFLPHHNYYSYTHPFSHQQHDVATIVSSPSVFDRTRGSGWCSWSLKAQKENSLNAHHQNKHQKSIRSREQFITVNSVLDDYIKNCNRLKPYQVAFVWNKLGKAVHQSCNTRQLRNFWVDHETSLRTLIAHTMHIVNEFDGRSTATVTHSLAKLMSLTDSNLSRVQSLWNALLLRTAMHVKSDGFDEQSVSNTLWAYAKADKSHTHPRLLDALATAALLRVEGFTPQGLANTAWAYATMKHKVPTLFDAMAKAAQECIDDFTPQELSNLAWAYAKADKSQMHQCLLDALTTQTMLQVDDFSPQGLANIAWSFAT
jgi:hypothetical protein